MLRWTRLGWNDLSRAGWPSLLHGLIITIASLVVVEVAVLFGLSTGLFALSKRLELGEPPLTKDAVDAWRRGSRCLFRLGLLLVLVATLWVGITKLVFHFFVDAEIERPLDFLRYVVLQGNDTFTEGTLLAGLVVALVFLPDGCCSSAAGRSRCQCKTGPGHQPPDRERESDHHVRLSVFLLLATNLSIATLMLGFLLLYPLMGHASWHAYRELVDVSRLPARSGSDGSYVRDNRRTDLPSRVDLGLGSVDRLYAVHYLGFGWKEWGPLGTFILFFVLAFGMLAFLIKHVVKWIMGLGSV